jgi:acetate kinase
MPRTLLVVNAGSSGIKFALYHADESSRLAPGPHGQLEIGENAD